MSRSLADPLYERLLSSFPATQAYTRADWDDDAMPEPVAHFLGHLLSHYSRREARRLRRARSDWVDYDHPDMETAVRTFFDTMETHTRVPADEWEDALRQATHHSTAHLVRPVHVLTDFVYAERQKRLPLSKILWRMQFFGPYAYLREAIQAFAQKHDLDALGPDRFERFLHRIDERITDGYDADRWLRLLDPLFAVARRATGREQVPTGLLRAFFAEKGRKGLEWQLEAHGEKGHKAVTPRALHRLIQEDDGSAPPASDTPAETSGRSPAPDRTPPDRDAPEMPPDRTEQPGSPTDDEIWGVAGPARPEGSAPRSASQPSQPDQSVPLWKRFQRGDTGATPSPSNNGGASGPSPQEGGDTQGGGDTQEGGTQEPLWARFRQERDERLSDAVTDEAPDSPNRSDRAADRTDEAETSSPGTEASPPGASLHEATNNASRSASSSGGAPDASPPPSRGGQSLDTLEQKALGVSNPPHRAVYVRQLFGGDQTAYRQVLRRLAGADSWGEASQVIAGDIFRKHKVNIYSDAAVHFTNAVEARFRDA